MVNAWPWPAERESAIMPSMNTSYRSAGWWHINPYPTRLKLRKSTAKSVLKYYRDKEKKNPKPIAACQHSQSIEIGFRNLDNTPIRFCPNCKEIYPKDTFVEKKEAGRKISLDFPQRLRYILMPTYLSQDKPWFNFGGFMGESSATVHSCVARRPSKSDSGFLIIWRLSTVKLQAGSPSGESKWKPRPVAFFIWGFDQFTRGTGNPSLTNCMYLVPENGEHKSSNEADSRLVPGNTKDLRAILSKWGANVSGAFSRISQDSIFWKVPETGKQPEPGIKSECE
jgi:hypothetical protein